MGETVTGVTTMRIDAGLDTGDILLQRELPIADDDTAETLAPRLAAMGAELMVETLSGLKSGIVHPKPQDHSKATLAPILKREDGLIDFQHSAAEIVNRMRGFQPWPAAFTSFRGKQLHVWAAKPVVAELLPAQLQVQGDRLVVGCGSGTALELVEVQLEGKKRLPARDFVHGYQPKAGEKLGESAGKRIPPGWSPSE